MKSNGPCGKFGQLQHGKVLIVNNLVAACTSTVQPLNLSCTLPTSYIVSWSKSQICTPTTRLCTDYWKPCGGLYINCTTLKLVSYITYTAWSVMIQAASLDSYNKVRYWLLTTMCRPVHQLYNPETCRVHYRHHIQCHSQKDKFVHLQQGKVLSVDNPVASCTSTVQPWNLSCTLPTSYTVSWLKRQVCTPTTRLGIDC